MPEPRESQPYRPPTLRRGPVPDLSVVPAFLRPPSEPRRSVPVGPSSAGRGIRGGASIRRAAPSSSPPGRGTSIRSGSDPRGIAPSARTWDGPAKPVPAPSRGASAPSRRGQPAPVQPKQTARRGFPDPATLPIPSLSRRRLGMAAAALAAAWLVIAFGRQVGEASAASARVEDLRLGNAALRDDVASLQDRIASVHGDRFITQQARTVRMGGPGEIPFTLAGDAPSLAPDAPGSAATRLGGPRVGGSPLDGWLEVLFGPHS